MIPKQNFSKAGVFIENCKGHVKMQTNFKIQKTSHVWKDFWIHETWVICATFNLYSHIILLIFKCGTLYGGNQDT